MTIGTLARRLHAVHRDERGMTLTELMVSVALMAIVATIFTTVLLSIQQAVMRQQARSEINDQARLGIEQMDREIRSGSNLFTTDAAHTCGGKDCQPSYSLRVYTQANAPTRTPPQQCVEWVIDGQKLYRRAWEAGASSTLGGWRMIAEGIVNRDLTPATTPQGPVPAFSQSASNKVLDITLMVNSRFGKPGAPGTVRMNTSIAIRNSGTGDPCSPIPSS
jgi:prepilin-type N-terminal cleavage/methylation domain-containing protein